MDAEASKFRLRPGLSPGGGPWCNRCCGPQDGPGRSFGGVFRLSGYSSLPSASWPHSATWPLWVSWRSSSGLAWFELLMSLFHLHSSFHMKDATLLILIRLMKVISCEGIPVFTPLSQ
jgi:hypothetical protein